MDDETILILVAAGAALYYLGPSLKNIGNAVNNVSEIASAATNSKNYTFQNMIEGLPAYSVPMNIAQNFGKLVYTW